MVEVERDNTRTLAGTGLGFGIAGTALNLLQNGGLGNVLGGSRCSDDHCVNRYEAAQAAEIARLSTEVKLRDANTYTDQKLIEMYRYVDGKFGCVESQIAQQNVYNATNTATLNCISGQIAQLQSLTKLIVPITSVCPEPMAQYNSWTAPTTA